MIRSARQPRVAVVQVLMFHTSPDAEDPRCVCSLCRQPFADPEFLERHAEPDEREFFDAMEADDQSLPIRMWPSGKGGTQSYEIRFHPACLETIVGPGANPGTLRFRKGLHVQYAWGDDEKGKLVVEPPVQR